VTPSCVIRRRTPRRPTPALPSSGASRSRRRLPCWARSARNTCKPRAGAGEADLLVRRAGLRPLFAPRLPLVPKPRDEISSDAPAVPRPRGSGMTAEMSQGGTLHPSRVPGRLRPVDTPRFPLRSSESSLIATSGCRCDPSARRTNGPIPTSSPPWGARVSLRVGGRECPARALPRRFPLRVRSRRRVRRRTAGRRCLATARRAG
jgi:hypothetical protein